METLQQQEQPADAAPMPPGPEGTVAPPHPPAPDDLAQPEPDELVALEVLMQLSGSSTSMGGDSASAASGSSSPRSVNDGPPAPGQELTLPRGPDAGGDGDEEEGEQEVSGRQRKMKRYRLIAEIYRATERFARFSI